VILKLKGKITKKTDQKFYFDDANWKKNLQYEGELESEEGNTYSFKYYSVRFSLFNLQIGLNISFDLTTDSNGKKIVKNIEKQPADYGFLVSHNERFHNGIFKTYEKEIVEFYDYNVRDEDEPIFDSLYVFDTITTQKEKYNNSFYKIGEENDSENFEVGQIRKGTVKNITDFGGFISIGHPTSDGLLHCKEIIWTDEKVNPYNYLRVGQSIDVLITRIIDGDRTKIDLSAKALIEPPEESFTHHRAVNIFRIDKMHPKIINELVLDIAGRDDVLPEAKIRAIHIIKNNPDLYKQHRDLTLPILFEYCKKQLFYHLDGLQYEMAFYLLQEYATYDISILELLDKFPEPFFSKLNSISIDYDSVIDDEDLDPYLFSIKNRCSIKDAKEFLELSKDFFNETNFGRIELLKDKIGIKPSIILDGVNND